MRKLLLLLLLCALPAHATYVRSSKSNFATAASTTCNIGNITAGNTVVMLVQANTTTVVNTPTSSGVSSWTLVQSTAPTINVTVWRGVATASGVTTVVAALASGTALIGSACGEYSYSTPNTSCGNTGSPAACSITNVIAVADIVEFGHSGVAGVTVASPYTEREIITSGGSRFCAFGDKTVSSTGSQSSSFTGGNSTVFVLDLGQASTVIVPRHSTNAVF